jgi:hypothetical protein
VGEAFSGGAEFSVWEVEDEAAHFPPGWAGPFVILVGIYGRCYNPLTDAEWAPFAASVEPVEFPAHCFSGGAGRPVMGVVATIAE